MGAASAGRAIRADAIHNRDAIVDAALMFLNTNPRASLAEIAKAAGVGRVTLYGHFASRDELLQAVIKRTMDRVDAQLSAIDLGGRPWESLEALIRSSWRIIAQFSGLLGVADELPPNMIRDYHFQPMMRVQALLLRGRSEGVFRTDHTIEWQTACFYAILHGAAVEIRAGRLTESDAPQIVPETLRALLVITPEPLEVQP